MQSGHYTARRRENASNWRGESTRRFSATSTGATFGGYSSTFSRNRNTVKHTGKVFGSITMFAIVLLQVAGLGLLYVSQSTRATSYDYELSAISSEIEDMEAERDDLAVERARLTSIAQAESSKVAAAMEEAAPAGYAE